VSSGIEDRKNSIMVDLQRSATRPTDTTVSISLCGIVQDFFFMHDGAHEVGMDRKETCGRREQFVEVC
jgi:hypothetical protein